MTSKLYLHTKHEERERERERKRDRDAPVPSDRVFNTAHVLIPEDLLRSPFLDRAKCLATAPRAEMLDQRKRLMADMLSTSWHHLSGAIEGSKSIYLYIMYIIYIWVKIVKLSSEKETQQSMSPYTSANYYFFHQKWAYFRRVPGFLE